MPDSKSSKLPEPSIDLSAQAKTADKEKSPGLTLSPGLLVGAVVALIAIYFGFSTLFGSSDSAQYQGFIGEVEQRTNDLKGNADTIPEAKDTKISR